MCCLLIYANKTVQRNTKGYETNKIVISLQLTCLLSLRQRYSPLYTFADL